MENTDVAVQAFNVAALLVWSAGGALAGLLTGALVLLILQLVGRRSPIVLRILRRTRAPMLAVLVTASALVGYSLHPPEGTTVWFQGGQHALVIVLIALVGWYVFSFTHLIEDAAQLRMQADVKNSRRFQTQAQVLRRVIQAVVVILTVIFALMTFPAARTAMATLIASAGILSVVAGLAAQSTLGNMFAGLQLAFTDAIRVGDTVTTMMGQRRELGTVEEVTLTYVVVRVWDERRILMPSSEFTSKPFENWTRRDTDLLGTVEIDFDWHVPMAQVRQQTQKLLLNTDLWDGRTWNVQMVKATGIAVTVRVVVSAGNQGDRHDLECHVREGLVGWAVAEIPWALPRTRSVPEEVHLVNRDVADQKVAELAEELSNIAGQTTELVDLSEDPLHAARLRASRQKAKRERRRSILRKEPGVGRSDDTAETRVMTSLGQWPAAPEKRASGTGERLFSGTPDAEERRKIFDGPGPEVLKEREETVVMQAQTKRSGEDHGA